MTDRQEKGNDHVSTSSRVDRFCRVDRCTMVDRLRLSPIGKETIMQYQIKGITKVEIENPMQAIATAFSTIPDQFNAKRNPANGRKLITNIPTQLLGNRLVSGSIVWKRNNETCEVELSEYAPARNPQSGEYAKSQSGDFYKAYRYQNLPDQKQALHEFWTLVSYFVLCTLTGMLPTPVKRSGQSTIMSQFINHWIDTQDIEIQAVKIVGGNGVEMTYTPDQVDQTLSLFNANAQDILANWNDSKRSSNAGDGINWA